MKNKKTKSTATKKGQPGLVQPSLKKGQHVPVQKPSKKVKENKYAHLTGLSVIILLGIFIYSNSFDSSFHFDDRQTITENPRIRNLFDLHTIWNYNPSRFTSMYTFALNYHFDKLDVWGYHLVNLVIHLINACLVYFLTLFIFSSPAFEQSPASRHKRIIALFTALLFVSHPLATQSVTYIVQRMASLVTLFYLLSLVLYVKARLTPKLKRSKYLLFTGSLLAAVLALISKENAFTLPLAIVLFEICFLQRKKFVINLKDYRVILFMAVIVGFIIIALFNVPPNLLKPIPPNPENDFKIVTPLNYLFTQFHVIVKYIGLLILPVNQNLDHDIKISGHFFEWRTLLSFAFLLSLFITGILSFKKYRIISFGIAWFFLTLAIESGIIPLSDLMFEHRTYLPSVGFFLILSFGLYQLLWNKYKGVAISVFLLIIGSNSILTFQRNKVWEDELSLWSDIVAKSPHKARGFNNRGIIFMLQDQNKEALLDFNKAIELKPMYYETYYNRANLFNKEKKYDQALTDYNKAIELEPKFGNAYFNRGNTYFSLQQRENAIADFTRVIETNSQLPVTYFNRGIAYWELGQMDKSIADYTKAIELDSLYAGAYINRAVSYGSLKQWDKAIADYSNVIKIDPNNQVAFINLASTYGNIGNWNLAIANFTRAIEMAPKNATYYNNRGIAYANQGEWEKAIADYSKALEIDPNFTNAYTNREVALSRLRTLK